MRPQWRHGQTHHHQRGWTSQFCRCCSSFGPSTYRNGQKNWQVSMGARRSQMRSDGKNLSVDHTIYDRIDTALQYADQNIRAYW